LSIIIALQSVALSVLGHEVSAYKCHEWRFFNTGLQNIAADRQYERSKAALNKDEATEERSRAVDDARTMRTPPSLPPDPAMPPPAPLPGPLLPHFASSKHALLPLVRPPFHQDNSACKDGGVHSFVDLQFAMQKKGECSHVRMPVST
jgi:hypothetical protein